jgi:O-antigen ligase
MTVSSDVEARGRLFLVDRGSERIKSEAPPDKRLSARAARYLNRIIFYTLLLLIILAAIPYGTVEPWWEAVFECVVFALGALWMIEGVLSRGWLFREHRIFLPILILILYALIQTLALGQGSANPTGLKLWRAISADPFSTRLFVLKLLALTLVGVMLLRYTISQRRLRFLVHTLIAVALVSAFFGIVRQTAQHSAGFILPALSPGVGYGQFINRNHFAFLMEMVLGLILGLIAARGVRRDQLLVYLALALPLWTALVLCNSRGGLFSMLTQILFLALLFSQMGARRESLEQRREAKGRLWSLTHSVIFRPLLIIALVLTIFVGAVWIGGESLTSRLETVSSEMTTDSSQDYGGAGRKEIWRATWEMIKDHPLMGVGFNGYWTAIPQYHHGSGTLTPQQAHNDYLELLASGGLIAVALVGWFLFLVFKEIRRSFRATDHFRRATAVGASIGFFGVAVHSVFDFGLHITINATVFAALIVIAGLRIEDERAIISRT